MKYKYAEIIANPSVLNVENPLYLGSLYLFIKLFTVSNFPFQVMFLLFKS
jgi:hypothetical protein